MVEMMMGILVAVIKMTGGTCGGECEVVLRIVVVANDGGVGGGGGGSGGRWWWW